MNGFFTGTGPAVMTSVIAGTGPIVMASIIAGTGPIVMAGRVPAIRASAVRAKMAGTRPAMTPRACVEITASIDALPVETVMAGEGPPSTPFPGPTPQAVDGGPAPAMTMKGRWLPSNDSVASPQGLSPQALRTATVSQHIRDSGAWSNQ